MSAETCYLASVGMWQPVRRALVWAAVWASAVAALGGCGRRATDADCRLIVDRAVELRMKESSNTDRAAIDEREREVRSALEGEIKDCESRRVTDRTMNCVRAATTTKELDACLH